MTPKRALLLVGSPKGLEKGLSARLGAHLLDALQGDGFAVEKAHVHAEVGTPDRLESLLQRIGRADAVLLFAPLYVDSFAAPVIALLEAVAERRAGAGRARLFALVQCGFPESAQNETAVAILERFALEAGWTWLGALAFGGGVSRTPFPRQALDLVGAAIANGEAIPERAFALVTRSPIPHWLYRFVGNQMWRREARKLRTIRRLRARPYAD